MSGVVHCQRLGPHDVGSPSAREHMGRYWYWKGVSPFEEFPDLDRLVARTVTGCHRHRNALMVLRACSRGLREIIDDEIAQWCAKFELCQRRQVDGTSKGADVYYRCIVQTEAMIVGAFGPMSGSTRALMKVSKMDHETYMAALKDICVLCGCKMTNEALVSDSEMANAAPEYVFAHKGCQRKHMVVLSSGRNFIQRCAEPRSLHRELSDVASVKPSGVGVDYAIVRNCMSPWFNRMYAAFDHRVANCPIVVWLGEHPRVRREDTLYGALGITKRDVALAVRVKASQDAESQRVLERRRMQCLKAKESLASTLQADLRLWLGKGRTRWRSIEDLDAFHPKLMSSTGIDHFVDPSKKRPLPPNISTYTHILNILDRTIHRLDCPLKSTMIDWVVSHLRVDHMFSCSPRDYCPTESDWSSSSIEAEADLHSRVLVALSKCKPSDVSVVSCKIVDTHRPHNGTNEVNYNIKLSMSLDTLEYSPEDDTLAVYGNGVKCELVSKFLMSHSSLCKLKFVAGELMSEQMQKTLPSVPTTNSLLAGVSPESLLVQEGDARAFLCGVLKACMSPGGNRARVHALSLLVSWKTYTEVVHSLRSHSCEEWDYT